MARGIEAPWSESSSISPTKIKAIQTVETEKFLSALKECRLSGKTVTCTLLVTNKSEADFVPIYVYRDGSWLYGDSGNEYYARSVTIGPESSDYRVSRKLAPQTPIKFILQFGDILPEASVAVAIVVRIESGDILFRNIRLTQ